VLRQRQTELREQKQARDPGGSLRRDEAKQDSPIRRGSNVTGPSCQPERKERSDDRAYACRNRGDLEARAQRGVPVAAAQRFAIPAEAETGKADEGRIAVQREQNHDEDWEQHEREHDSTEDPEEPRSVELAASVDAGRAPRENTDMLARRD